MVTNAGPNHALIIKNFHPDIDDILALALSKEGRLRQVRLESDQIFQKIIVDMVNYGAHVCKGNDFEDYMLSTRRILISQQKEILEHFKLRKLYFRSPRGMLSQMGDGDSLARHSDERRIAGPNYELITLLYFHLEPKGFSGGELELFWKDGIEVIKPDHNMLVAFPACIEHAVKTVHCPSKEYAHSRFVLVQRFCAPLTLLQLSAKSIRVCTRLLKRLL